MQPAALSALPAAQVRPLRPSPSKAEAAPALPPGVSAASPSASQSGTQMVRTSPQRVFFRGGDGQEALCMPVPAPALSGSRSAATSPSRPSPAAAARPCSTCGASPLSLDISGVCVQCQPAQQRQQAPPLGAAGAAPAAAPAPAVTTTADAEASTAPLQPVCEGGAQTEAPRATSEATCQYEAPTPDAPPPLTPQQALVLAQFVAITGEPQPGAEAWLRGCAWALEAALLGRLAPGSPGGSSGAASTASLPRAAAEAATAAAAGGGGGGGSALSPSAAAQAVGSSPGSLPPPKPAATKPARTLNFITKAN
jgi:hypothetical protein